MAHTVKITKLLDGSRHAIFHVYLKHDGQSGDLVGAKLIDPLQDLLPVQAKKPRFRIEEIWWDFYGFGVRLEYDDVVDNPVWVVTAGSGNYVDLKECLGGLKDRSGLDGNGKLLFSTIGFTGAPKQGTMIVKIRK